ncbi:ABC transporter ATP-binding protein [Agrococcus versicolor]|uniref:ABC transporter ATP-binding protein n=1 Tax=Agrococcus versicolor TaxID=501482 RepID=A0ABN3AJY1_9MICO
MDVRIEQVAMGRALPPTDAAFASGEATLLVVETEQRPTVLGLVAAGRMVPRAGRVLLDGVEDRRGLRARVALVDAPRASDPDPAITLAGVLAEELLFAGVPGSPRSVRGWAAQLDVLADLDVPIADVAPAVRTRLLAELAILRDDVEAIVLASPDRHGGDPHDWWALARSLADRGFAVLVLASPASARVLCAADASARHAAPRTALETQEAAA